MGWLGQSYTQPLSGLHLNRVFSSVSRVGRTFPSHHARLSARESARESTRKQYHLGLALLIAACLLGPFKTHAIEMADAALKNVRQNTHRMSDPDLSRIWAKGIPDVQFRSDRIFEGASTFAAGGNAVTVLGDLVTLLNPPFGLLVQALDAQTSFNNVVFNPRVPATIVTADGTSMVRLPSTIGELSFKSVHLKGSSGASFGDVDIRNIELGGTRIIVKRH